MIIFHSIVGTSLWRLENILQVARQVWNSPLALLILEESQYNDSELNDQYEDAEEDGEVA